MSTKLLLEQMSCSNIVKKNSDGTRPPSSILKYDGLEGKSIINEKICLNFFSDCDFFVFYCSLSEGF